LTELFFVPLAAHVILFPVLPILGLYNKISLFPFFVFFLCKRTGL